MDGVAWPSPLISGVPPRLSEHAHTGEKPRGDFVTPAGQAVSLFREFISLPSVTLSLLRELFIMQTSRSKLRKRYVHNVAHQFMLKEQFVDVATPFHLSEKYSLTVCCKR